MTCIVAKVHDGKVHMVGDCMGSDGFQKHIFTKTSKVFSVSDFIIGYTTSFRMGQILQYSWEPPQRLQSDDNDDLYIYKHVVNSIKKCFEDNSFGFKDKSEFEAGNFLIGWKGRLFEMQSNMSLMEIDKFASVGCGCYHALSAMKTLDWTGQYQDEPEEFLRIALLIASDSVTGVSEEYCYVYEN